MCDNDDNQNYYNPYDLRKLLPRLTTLQVNRHKMYPHIPEKGYGRHVYIKLKFKVTCKYDLSLEIYKITEK